ncbi:MAG: hypothetical protein LC114_23195 [Bryobacterales bacterium]|nr:hypothetical protein [Bryobacterales bacterium]
MNDRDDRDAYWLSFGVYPDSVNRGGLLARVSPDELMQFLQFHPSGTHPSLLHMKAMALIELLYRDRIRTREAYEAAWVVFHGDSVPPPYLLEAPSEMNPHCRDWVSHHVPASHKQCAGSWTSPATAEPDVPEEAVSR